MTGTLESRVAWAARRYATARPAELKELILDLWQELHATQAAWGEDAAFMNHAFAERAAR
jgi:hypothetical protein